MVLLFRCTRSPSWWTSCWGWMAATSRRGKRNTCWGKGLIYWPDCCWVWMGRNQEIFENEGNKYCRRCEPLGPFCDRIVNGTRIWTWRKTWNVSPWRNPWLNFCPPVPCGACKKCARIWYVASVFMEYRLVVLVWYTSTPDKNLEQVQACGWILFFDVWLQLRVGSRLTRSFFNVIDVSETNEGRTPGIGHRRRIWIVFVAGRCIDGKKVVCLYMYM